MSYFLNPFLMLIISLPRNFAASQTKGVSSAIYKKYSSRAAARAAFDLARERGETAVLQ